MAQEKNFEYKVKALLQKYRCWSIKYWGGGHFTKSGIPDILACCYGKFFGIEVKADKGEPSHLQIANLIKIDKAGGFAILLYPKDYDKLERILEALNNDDLGNAYLQYYILKGRWKEWGHRFKLL